MNKSLYRSQDIKETTSLKAVDPLVGWHERVVRQVEQEWWAAWWFTLPRVKEWQRRLKLYNNQMRDKDRVGSPDIFSNHQTVLASLYDDKMSVIFGARRQEDEEAAENFTDKAQRDYEDGLYAQADHDWDFDSSLYGRGLMLFNDWDYDLELPVAEVIDPLTFMRDPTCQSVNGTGPGKNAMRFGYREVRKTTKELQEGDYFNLSYLRRDAGAFQTFSPFWDAERARKLAQGYEVPFQSYNLTANLEWTITQGFTVIDGRKAFVELANNRTLLIRLVWLGRHWPIVDRPLYPIAHDWDGVSIPDIVEDKQRFRAQLLNVYGDAAKRLAYPMWIFDENKIRKNVDKDPGMDKYIPVIGDPRAAVAEFPKSSAGDGTQFILDFLDKASTRALGLSDLSTSGLGQMKGGRNNLYQTAYQQGRMDARNSLALKIWGWSERERWLAWFDLHGDYFYGAAKKEFAKTDGAGNSEYKVLRPKDLRVSHPQGLQIEIETRSLSEAKKLRRYQQKKDYLQLAFNLPETDKVFAMRDLGGEVYRKKELELLIPYSAEEMQALEENDKLDAGEAVRVKLSDDHKVHLRVNGMAKDTPEAEAHLKAHRLAESMIKENPGELNPGRQEPPDGGHVAAAARKVPGPERLLKNPTPQTRLASPAVEGAGVSQ